MSQDYIEKRPVGRPRKTPAEKQLTEKRKRDLATATTFGQELVEAGDNTKFLSHALTIMRWPLIDITDPEEVRQRISDYFQLCVNDDMKPSVKGLENALRVQRSTIWEWKQGNYRAGTHQAIICEAYDVMEALWQDYMQNGKINPVSGIFLAKNLFGGQYTDKQEFVLTPNQGGVPEAIDAATIEAKYAELPDSED
jgi:hypothetical protein